MEVEIEKMNQEQEKDLAMSWAYYGGIGIMSLVSLIIFGLLSFTGLKGAVFILNGLFWYGIANMAFTVSKSYQLIKSKAKAK